MASPLLRAQPAKQSAVIRLFAGWSVRGVRSQGRTLVFPAVGPLRNHVEDPRQSKPKGPQISPG